MQITRPATPKPIVVAENMLVAQGYRPTREERATLTEWAGYMEALTDSRNVSVRVEDSRGLGIGHLIFVNL